MQGNGSLKINDDEFHSYKTMISEMAGLLEGQLLLLSSALGSNIDTFITEIDELDKNLYCGY